jgi:hypothetical protein
MSLTFSPKDPRETFPVSIDFTNLLGVGETVSSVVFSVQVVNAVDPNAAAMISGAGTVSGNVCSQTITGGINGVTYLISALATTSLNNKLIGAGLLTVQAGGA